MTSDQIFLLGNYQLPHLWSKDTGGNLEIGLVNEKGLQNASFQEKTSKKTYNRRHQRHTFCGKEHGCQHRAQPAGYEMITSFWSWHNAYSSQFSQDIQATKVCDRKLTISTKEARWTIGLTIPLSSYLHVHKKLIKCLSEAQSWEFDWCADCNRPLLSIDTVCIAWAYRNNVLPWCIVLL